jgi:hypothetical protein
MTEGDVEVLVILDPASAQAFETLGERMQVTQRLPPRLAVVRLEPARLNDLHACPGVRDVLTGEGEPPGDLNEHERLFAEAWLLSQRPKRRPGAGLAWDAPGFLPPDPPPERRPPHT